jgi:hypothetical protein
MERVTEIVLEGTQRRLEQDILKYNPKVIDFKCEYEIKGDYIFIIGYSKLLNEYGDLGIYRMICVSIYGEKLYEDGNVIDYASMYGVDKVIERTKGYFNHYSKRLNQL